MKRIYILSIFMSFNFLLKAQVNTASEPRVSLAEENAFLDASSYTKSPAYDKSQAKGLIFPQVDLTQFEFKIQSVGRNFLPTAFDGMIVYNIGTGNTSDHLFTGNQMEVEPGFYYFHNPQGKNLVATANTPTDIENAVKAGKWVPLGSGGSATIKTTETRLGKIDNVQLYGIKGTFQVTAADGATINNFLPNALVSPTPITSIHSIKIYDSTKKLVTSSLVSYDIANNKAVTGMGNMSIPLPVGTYSYVLEYFR